MLAILMAAVLAGTPRVVARIPAPSADSIMAGMRELIPSEASPALAASTAGAAEAFTVAEVFTAAAATAAEAIDSSHEVIKQ